MSIKDILIIDDENVINDVVIKIGNSEGYKVDSLENAFDALELLQSQKYKLILCDIMIPGMDGFQFLAELQKRKIDIPVIIITGFSTVENAVKSLSKGAIDFIPKPFTYDELMSSISRGLKYSKIYGERGKINNNANKDSVLYVSCPPKYLRMNYSGWMHLENEGTVLVGVTDLFLRTIERIDNIQLLNVDEVIYQGNSCAKIGCVDELVHNVLAPMGGKIIERNLKILENNSLIEKDPYFQGWLYRIIPADFEYDVKYLEPCSSDRY